MITINMYICQPYWPDNPQNAAEQNEALQAKLDALVAPIVEVDEEGNETVIEEQKYSFSYANNLATTSRIGANNSMLSIVAQNLDIAVTADAIFIADITAQSAGDASEYFIRERDNILNFHLSNDMPILYESLLTKEYLKNSLGFLMSDITVGSIIRHKVNKALRLVYIVGWNYLNVLYLKDGQIAAGGMEAGTVIGNYDIVGSSALNARDYLNLTGSIKSLLRDTSLKNKKVE